MYFRIIILLISNLIWSQNQKPNIIWIVCEDISPDLSFYGDNTAKTPHLDALAKESTIYTHAYATTPVCGPSRSAIITGMLPTSIGTMHMRTGNDVMSWGKRVYAENILKGENKTEIALDVIGKPIREYSAVIPEYIKCFTQYLREDGYYCTNNQKTDYQFAAPQIAWDENDPKAHFKNVPKNTPFFSVFNFGETHESSLWKNKDLPLTVNPDSVTVPPYLHNNIITRKDIARHYSNIELLDKQIGKLIEEIKKAGYYENSYIFFYSDHGGPLPHEKREIYNEGLQVPLLIKSPNQKNNKTEHQLISLMDLGPTLLNLASIKIPNHIEGIPFLGKNCKQRKYLFATSDRFDEFTDRIRMVRNNQFVFLKNYYPNIPYYKDIEYRKSIPLMNEMLNQKELGQLNQYQLKWFQNKPKEELYDDVNDPFHQKNLIDDPSFEKIAKELRNQIVKQFENKYDFGSIPESQLINLMWPNNIQPTTSEVKYEIKNNKLKLFTDTKGANITYKSNGSQIWLPYTKPIELKNIKNIFFKAERIGYKTSKTETLNFN